MEGTKGRNFWLTFPHLSSNKMLLTEIQGNVIIKVTQLRKSEILYDGVHFSREEFLPADTYNNWC